MSDCPPGCSVNFNIRHICNEFNEFRPLSLFHFHLCLARWTNPGSVATISHSLVVKAVEVEKL